MTLLKKIVMKISIIFQIVIWPTGLYLMLNGYNPEDIGQVMATCILVGSFPIFWAQSEPLAST